MTGLGRHHGQRRGAGVGLALLPVDREEVSGHPKSPDRVVVVLALLPPREHEAGALQSVRRVRVVVGDECQRGRAVDLHREDVQAPGDVEAGVQVPPGRTELATDAADVADAPVDDRAHPVAFMNGADLPAQLERARPLAELAQDVGHARHASGLGTRVAGDPAQIERARERLLRVGVVTGRLEHRAQPLIGVGGLRRQPVIERE